MRSIDDWSDSAMLLGMKISILKQAKCIFGSKMDHVKNFILFVLHIQGGVREKNQDNASLWCTIQLFMCENSIMEY